jgi:hypothetical protein
MAAAHRRGGPRALRVDYTLPGLDRLLHRLGWSVQVPARQAVERDEERITAWREETWPQIEDRGGPGRLADLRRRVRPGADSNVLIA